MHRFTGSTISPADWIFLPDNYAYKDLPNYKNMISFAAVSVNWRQRYFPNSKLSPKSCVILVSAYVKRIELVIGLENPISICKEKK